MSALHLYVAHYGHPLLKGAKHWSFLLGLSDDQMMTCQITGSTYTYELKEPELVSVSRSSSYLGKVLVGRIDKARQDEFFEVLRAIPIVKGSIQWNCQSWILEGMDALRRRAFDVDNLSHGDLARQLQSAKREG